MSKIAIALASAFVGIFLALLLWWNRISVKNALLKRELEQDESARVKNIKANEAHRKKRKTFLKPRIDPNDPWDGV